MQIFKSIRLMVQKYMSSCRFNVNSTPIFAGEHGVNFVVRSELKRNELNSMIVCGRSRWNMSQPQYMDVAMSESQLSVKIVFANDSGLLVLNEQRGQGVDQMHVFQN